MFGSIILYHRLMTRDQPPLLHIQGLTCLVSRELKALTKKIRILKDIFCFKNTLLLLYRCLASFAIQVCLQNLKKLTSVLPIHIFGYIIIAVHIEQHSNTTVWAVDNIPTVQSIMKLATSDKVMGSIHIRNVCNTVAAYLTNMSHKHTNQQCF